MRCVLFVPFSKTIRRWFGVTGSQHMEANEKCCMCGLYLCGGPAGDTGSSPAGKQPVGQSEEAGL